MVEEPLEKVMQLAAKLSLEEKQQLILRLAQSLRQEPPCKPKTQSLRGIWQGKFPEDLDVDAALSEIRRAWETEWTKVCRQKVMK